MHFGRLDKDWTISLIFCSKINFEYMYKDYNFVPGCGNRDVCACHSVMQVNRILRRVYVQQSAWRRTFSQQVSRENTQEPLPFLDSKARNYRLNDLAEIRKKRSQYLSYSLPIGITMFAGLMYVCFVMKDPEDSKNINSADILKDVEKNSEATNDKDPKRDSLSS